MVPGQQPGKPRVSVCIANYNGDDVLEACLASVAAQTCSFAVETLVHDDASTDGSPALVRSRFPAVTLLCADENVGFCRSNNRLAAAARGDYLLLLNNDATLHPGALEALYRYQDAHGDAGILTLPQYAADSGELLDRGMHMDLFANPIPNTAPGTREVATVMGSCLWISRALWEELGGFPEWFGSIGEDMYLCCLARLRGRAVVAVDETGYDHVVGHSFGGGRVEGRRLRSSLRRRALSELNKNRVMALCYPGFTVLLLLPQALLLLLEGLALSLRDGNLRVLRQIYLPAIARVAGDWRRLRRERRAIQAARRRGIADFFRPLRLTHHKLWLLRRYGLPHISETGIEGRGEDRREH
ncbi:MAG TPA: glycosyltransferase family 2 protein [Pseudohaliea sp.]|nr:glycosyltransferase family 2 protein [Pseudohaliea sp.]